MRILITGGAGYIGCNSADVVLHLASQVAVTTSVQDPRHDDACRGEAINIGGGPENTLSIWSEFGPMLAQLKGEPVAVNYGPWRPGNQRVFMADIRKAEEMLGWRPTISPAQGVAGLYEWVDRKRALFLKRE